MSLECFQENSLAAGRFKYFGGSSFGNQGNHKLCDWRYGKILPVSGFSCLLHKRQSRNSVQWLVVRAVDV